MLNCSEKATVAIISGGIGWGAGAERRQFSERSVSAVNVFELSEKKPPSDDVASVSVPRQGVSRPQFESADVC